MTPVWSFGPPRDDTRTYSDGTVIPTRVQDVILDGRAIGYVEIHMHRRAGEDKAVDASVGTTTVIYGPAPAGGN